MISLVQIAGTGRAVSALTCAVLLLSGADVALAAQKDDRVGSSSAKAQDAASASRNYCVNIGDKAAEVRAGVRVRKLKQLEEQINRRIMELEKVRDDLAKWMKRREQFVDLAQDNLVEIYSKMTAEAAAQQLTLMHEETAAAILLKLNVRVSSAILNEIEPKRAARLAGLIAGAARKATRASKS